jgi:hypothetical protein
VFGDGDASARGDDGARRRDVDRIVVVAPGTAGIDQRRAVGLDGPGGIAHPLCEPGDLGFGLALGSQGGQQRADLCLGCLLEDESGGIPRLVDREILAVGHTLDVILHC